MPFLFPRNVSFLLFFLEGAIWRISQIATGEKPRLIGFWNRDGLGCHSFALVVWRFPVLTMCKPGRRHGRRWDSRYRHPCVGSHRSWSFSLASAPSLLRQIACMRGAIRHCGGLEEDESRASLQYIYIYCPLQEHRGTFQVDPKSQYAPCTIEWSRIYFCTWLSSIAISATTTQGPSHGAATIPLISNPPRMKGSTHI